MNAIRLHAFGGPENLGLESVPLPEPGPGQVRVRIFAAGVNPVETYIRSGAYAKLPELPWTPGTDGAGIVDAVGVGVDRWTIGERVYTAGTITGTYAEMALATPNQLHPLPEILTFEQGAAVGIPYATAWRALVDIGGARAGGCVLVHGATGGVGIATVQIARRLGLEVHATSGSARGTERLHDLGVAHVHRHDQAGSVAAALASTPDGRGFDVIIEMAAHLNLGADVALLAPGGRVVVVGSRGPVTINPRELMLRDASVHGMLLANTPPDRLAEIHGDLAVGFADGSLSPVVGRSFRLADAAAAHAAVMEPGADGKLVLLP